MTSPPDKLFRQGLEHYQKPAPGSAWERIESGLDRKKHKSPWIKIAATLLLLMVASFAIWQFNDTDTSVATISKESSSDSLITDTISSAATDESKDKIRESSGVSREAVVNREASDVSHENVGNREVSGGGREFVVNRESSGVRRELLNNKSSKTFSQQSAVLSPQPTVLSPQSAVSTASIDHAENMTESASQATITSEISISDASSDSKRTSITYSAEEVNAKYLKKESTTEATPEKKNASGLQKVIDLALDLKNEGSVLGEIREKKNEWLSLNMPSNKRETNK
jgi:hypothetical protein